MTVVDAIRSRAAERPAQAALLVDDGAGGTRAISYAELVKSADTHAARLRADGVGPADRCGLAAPHGPHFVELALGILAADACLVPIPDDRHGPVFEAFAARAHLHHALTLEAGGPALRSFEAAPVDGADDLEFRALRPAYLRFTSGTTNERKGVVLGHDAVAARLAAANRGLGIGPSDRVLWLLPMAHHFVVSILLYLRSGASILLPSRSLARPVLDFAARESASVLYASPHHYRLLSKDTSELALPDVRLAISTADGLRRDVAEAFAARFGVALAQALGIIEVGLPVANLDAAAEKPEALGRPLPDFEVWLRGDDGRPLQGGSSPERCGEICIRGPGMLDAYTDPWLLAPELLEPDGFRSGDQGWLDADGSLHLAGRRANRISMAGMKFFAEEVEEVLDTHPRIRESRVLPRDHPHLGQIPVAEIVPRDPAEAPDRSELVRHCRGQLPGYKVPREFRVVETLPRTSSGKVRRADG